MNKSFSTEFVFQIFSLIIAAILVHAIYVSVIRPNAAAIQQEQRVLIAEDSDYVPERSLFVIVQDFEQEACFILMLWAFSIMGYKARHALRERGLLFVPLAAPPRAFLAATTWCPMTHSAGARPAYTCGGHTPSSCVVPPSVLARFGGSAV